MSVVYHDSEQYPLEHWALQYPDASQDFFIGIVEIRKVSMAIYLHPHDARGYWTIVRLVSQDLRSTLNRAFTLDERYALQIAMLLTAAAYEQAGCPITQMLVLGNNSQHLRDSGEIEFGNKNEPSMLHGHVICRGNPDVPYIAGVPLRSPAPGAVFNVHGKGTETWNNSKVQWRQADMQAVALTMAQEIRKLVDEEKFEVKLVSSKEKVEEHKNP
jgi:hypothetical protein